MVAGRAALTLPRGVWDPAGVAVLSDAVARRIQQEESDPESFAPSHRFDGLAAPDSLPAADGADDAPRSFVRALEALRAALSTGDPAQLSDPMARVALAACDLADPFQMTSPARDELPGARARFGDALDPALLAAPGETQFAPSEAPAPWQDGGLAAAVALARASAVLRDSVEHLELASDDSALTALQQDRLAAAAALAGQATELAWRAASLDATPPSRTLHVWPNPVLDSATLSFVAPAAGAARLELYDLSGRRVASAGLGRLAAGPHLFALDRTRVGALPAGMYFARLSIAGQAATARLTYSPR